MLEVTRLGGNPCGRNPVWEESRLGGIPCGRNNVGRIQFEFCGGVLCARYPVLKVSRLEFTYLVKAQIVLELFQK